MIFSYGFSTVGKSHITNGTVCQDSHMIKELDNGWIIAAVADGVGSAKNSEIGSNLAAKTVVEFCAECMPWDYSVIGIKSMLRTAYNYALKQIIKESEKTGEPIESYDTTLTTVIYDGHRIIYGHSGDGAIIGLNTFGDYIQITKPQKGADMVSVLPLRSGYTVWNIDTYNEELAAVLIMTDGMLDGVLCPYLLKQGSKAEVYTPVASFFADPLGVPDEEKSQKCIKEEIEEFIIADDTYDSSKFFSRLESIYKARLGDDDACEIISDLEEKRYSIAFMQSVTDDKTLVSLINNDIVVDTKDLSFYSEPNWEELQEAWNRKAYPHLYTDDEDKTQIDEQVVDSEDVLINNEEDEQDSVVEIKSDTEEQTQSAEQMSVDASVDRGVILVEDSQGFEGKTKEFLDNRTKQNTQIEGRQSDISQPVYQTEKPAPKHEKPRKKGFLNKFIGFWQV